MIEKLLEKLVTSDDLDVEINFIDLSDCEVIKKLRETKGLTLGELAYILDVNIDDVEAMEKGSKCPSRLQETILCDLYGIPEEKCHAHPRRGAEECPIDILKALADFADFKGYERLTDLIHKVIFHNPETIVIWKDGTKTVVRAQGEKFDQEKGVLMALNKYLFGKHYGRDLQKVIDGATFAKPRIKKQAKTKQTKTSSTKKKTGGRKR